MPGTQELPTEGPRVLGAFLADRGWSMDDTRPVQAVYQPRRSLALRYQVRARNAAGEARLLTLCAEARARPSEPSPAPALFGARYGLADPVTRAGPYLVWAFPYDPSLPGLYDAAQGSVVREALGAAGWRRPVAVAVEPIRYRPRRRAVFRYLALDDGEHEVVFGKVLRDKKAGRMAATGTALARRHPRSRRALRLALPLAPPRDGALLFPSLPGRSLRDLLVSGGSLPAPHRVAGLLDDLPRAGRRGATADPSDRSDAVRLVEHGRDLLHRLVPEARADVDRVADAVVERAHGDPLPPRLVHGDLYEAQVFVGDNYTLGLIDLDDVGPGDPALDAANFCAHLIALGLSVPAAWQRLVAYRTIVRAAFLDRLGIGPPSLAWREAMCLLLLASGPFRVLDPRWPSEVRRRVDLALRLLEHP